MGLLLSVDETNDAFSLFVFRQYLLSSATVSPHIYSSVVLSGTGDDCKVRLDIEDVEFRHSAQDDGIAPQFLFLVDCLGTGGSERTLSCATSVSSML